MQIGSLQLIKAVTRQLLNVSSNSDVHVQCLDQDITTVLVDCLRLLDYEVITIVYQTIGNFLTSDHKAVRSRMVQAGFL